MTSITGAVAKVKSNPEQLLGATTVLEACRHVGHTWRNRVLDPLATVRLFMLQILHGNIACQGLRHLSDLTFTATAYVPAASVAKVIGSEVNTRSSAPPASTTAVSSPVPGPIRTEGSSKASSERNRARRSFGSFPE